MDEERSFHPMPEDNGNFGVERYLRDTPPAHYTVEIESFSELSKLLKDCKLQSYESDVFESGDFKWQLSLYPNGNEEGDGEGHISLYLVIAETENLPIGWEVNVNFRLFVHDQILDKYMTIQDASGKVKRFYKMKKQWGFDRLLPLSCFNNATNGYLVRDRCVFGVEVFVVNYTGRGESVALYQRSDETYTWKIEKFSSLDKSIIYSDVYSAGNRKWKLRLYPKGVSRVQGESLSLYLELEDKESFPCNRKTPAKFMLRIKDQCHGEHQEHEFNVCFAPPKFAKGKSSFLSLKRLHDASAGFLVNGTLIIEAQILRLSSVKSF